MGSQIRFFKKNLIDISNVNASIIVTDPIASNTGQDFVNYLRNRKNSSAWITTGSTDAANTILDVSLDGTIDVDSILLIKHNFKAYTIQYWTGVAYADFSTPISEASNTNETTFYQFTAVKTEKIKIIINSTMTVDADKIMRQLIITEELGKFNGWPIIRNPKISTNKKKNKMLSGKINLVESIESFSTTLEVKVLSDSDDLDLIETVYQKRVGVLVWINSNDDDQFSSLRLGYRKEDIYLVRPIDEYSPEFFKGIYQSGIKFKMKLEESIS
jgi:hypothetical protein